MVILYYIIGLLSASLYVAPSEEREAWTAFCSHLAVHEVAVSLSTFFGGRQEGETRLGELSSSCPEKGSRDILDVDSGEKAHGAWIHSGHQAAEMKCSLT